MKLELELEPEIGSALKVIQIRLSKSDAANFKFAF